MLLTVGYRKIVEGIGEGKINFKTDLSTAAVPVAITGLESGFDYFIYCITSEKPLAETTVVSESVGLKVKVV